MSKIVITGGTGFIGGHLASRLIKMGHDVVQYDINHVADWDERLRGSFVYGSILNAEGLTYAFKSADYVFHLAGVASTVDCCNNIADAININCIGTTNVLNACVLNDVKKVFIASSSLVSHRVSDSCIDLSQEGHVYTTTKLFMEMLAKDFETMHNLSHTILRFGVCYGPYMSEGVVVHNFLVNALYGRPMTVYGDGKQWRYFIFIDDLIDGCIAALNSDIVDGRTYNIIPTWKTTINNVAKTIQHITGGDIAYVDKRKHDFTLQELSHELPMNELEWEASTKLLDGMLSTLVWYRAHTVYKEVL